MIAARRSRPTLYNLIDGMVRFLGINQYSPHNTTSPGCWWTSCRSLFADIGRPSAPSAFAQRIHRRAPALPASPGSRTRQRLSCAINAVYVRRFGWHLAPRTLPASCTRLAEAYRVFAKARSRPARLFTQFASHPGSGQGRCVLYFRIRARARLLRIAHLIPARPALRDSDLADLFEITREDLEQQTSLPLPTPSKRSTS